MDDFYLLQVTDAEQPSQGRTRSMLNVCIRGSENDIMNNLEKEKTAKIIVSHFLCVGIYLRVSASTWCVWKWIDV